MRKKNIKWFLVLMMVVSIVFGSMVVTPIKVNAAKKIASVNKSKLVLKKNKAQKVKVTCLYSKGAQFYLSVDDPSVAEVDWVGKFKSDKKGRQYCYIKIKGLRNGTTKIKIKNDVNNKVTKINVKVKGFSKTDQFDKLAKDIQKKAYSNVEYNGYSYPSFCLKMRPLMEAAYDKSTGNVILTYKDVETSKTDFIDKSSTVVYMFYNAKKPKETKVEIYSLLSFRDSDWYSFRVISTIDASNYRSGDIISISEVLENKNYDAMTAIKTSGRGDAMKTLSDQELIEKASSALEIGLKGIDNSLKDNGGYSLKGIGFDKYN